MLQLVSYDTESGVSVTTEARALSNAVITIDSVETLNQATDFVRKIKELGKKIEAHRTSITKPLNDATKAVNDLFREPREILDATERKIKSAILEYQAEQQRIADEAARKALAERLELEAQARKAQEEAEAARRGGYGKTRRDLRRVHRRYFQRRRRRSRKKFTQNKQNARILILQIKENFARLQL
ncbi:MAG: hypothetical protein LBF86_04815 [Helicobacteraceae bacterium]|jgi:hypothetical protein|nr:hypothetical protein [Helicobacteraceae bacterium]